MMESVSAPSLVGTGKMKLNLASDLHSHQGRVGPQVILERHWLKSERKITCNARRWPGVEQKAAVSSAVSFMQTTSSIFHHWRKKSTTQTKQPEQSNKKHGGGGKSNQGVSCLQGSSCKGIFQTMEPVGMATSARFEHLFSRNSVFPVVPQHGDVSLFSPSWAAVFVSCFRLILVI